MNINDVRDILEHDGDFFFIVEGNLMFRTIHKETIREVTVGDHNGKLSVILNLIRCDRNPINEKAVAKIENVHLDWKSALIHFETLLECEYL